MLADCKTCGAPFKTFPSRLRQGRKRCPACVATSDRPGPRSHGQSYTRLYSIWSTMKSRCSQNNCDRKGFEDYGGRGITVCDEWQNSFEAFRDWSLANGYADHLTLDRILVNGNYEPGNCRWITRSNQMRNCRKKKSAKTSRFKGVSRDSKSKQWRAQLHRDGHSPHIGVFRTQLAAAKAYDDAARMYFGDIPKLNFPERKS